MFISANFSPHRFAISAQANDKLETAGVSADILMGDVFHTPQKYWSFTNRTHPLFVGNTNNAFNFVTDILAKKTENRQTDPCWEIITNTMI